MTAQERTFRQAPGVLGADVADRHVLLSDSLHYHGVDEVARRIWDLLEHPRSVEELVATLTAQYDVPPDRCRTEVEAFLDQLDAAGLVLVA